MKNLKEILAKYSNHPDFLGVNLNEVNQKGSIDDAPLHIASRIGTKDDINDLIMLGAIIDISGDLGNTPLHYAAMIGRFDIVMELIKYGANRELKNDLGQNASDVATLSGHELIAKYLAGC